VKVLRIYHSGVVSAWRQREREMRRWGVDVTLVSPTRWNEGGADVDLDTGDDDWVVPARTLGSHPYIFLYDPRPLIRLFRQHRFDLIDLHEEPASLAALEVRLLSWFGHRRTPLVVYGAQNISKRFPWPFRSIERGTLRRATGAYPCNRDAGDIYRDKGFTGLIQVMGLGVEVERFGASDHRAAQEPTTIGYVGRLAEHKGVQVVLDAMVALPAALHLQICGEGPYRQALEAHVARLGLGDRVEFLGYSKHGDLPSRYAKFDVAVIPSQTRENWVEQFGRVAIEAMASGVPVIAANSGALPDVLKGAGVLVSEADSGAWFRELSTLLNSPARRIEMAAAGRQRARTYSWSAIATQHIAFYRKVLDQ
jgi:glycosyltransferase involved in cell wall biosynthesis